ncbi:MAG TPA: hypothetical protein VGE35_00375 [Candidatus Paceibacterota bacterium]
MKMHLLKAGFLSVVLLAAVVGASKAEAQVSCPAGSQCAWISTTDVTRFGVRASASAQGFYNDQTTKDKLCQLSGYESNPGTDWSVRQLKWSKCNAEYHVDWRNGGWDSHKCGGDSYVSEVYCVRSVPAAAEPVVTISASPMAVRPFNKTTLTWSSQNTTSCTASGDWSGSKSTSGSEESGTHIIGGKTFVLTCTGPGGTASGQVNTSLYILASAPTVAWVSNPASSPSGIAYVVSAIGTDSDKDLDSIIIKKSGVTFATGGAGDGEHSLASAQSTDTGPATITYTAIATDATGRTSPEISHTVTINTPSVTAVTPLDDGTTPRTGPAPTLSPIVATVSASPTCVAPGGTISVSGSASGGVLNGNPTITSNVLEKDSNKDGAYGAIASRSDAGSNSATVSVPFSETSNRYDFRTVVNGSVYSAVQSVTVDSACGAPTGICALIPALCGQPTVPAQPISPSVSLSVGSTCVQPGSSVTFRSTAGGTITSHGIEKDSNQDGVYGGMTGFAPGAGTQTYSSSFGEGLYDFKSVVNGNIYSAPVRVSVSPACAPTVFNPGIPGGGTGGTGGGGSMLPTCTGGKILSGSTCVCPSSTVDAGSFCATPSFTLTANPSTVKVRSIAGYSGVTEEAINLSVNPSFFTAPVTIEVVSVSAGLQPEFSFNNGAFGSSLMSPFTLNSGGLQYLPVKIRFAGKLSSSENYSITFRATGVDSRVGAIVQTATVNLDSKPLFPGYIEI